MFRKINTSANIQFGTPVYSAVSSKHQCQHQLLEHMQQTPSKGFATITPEEQEISINRENVLSTSPTDQEWRNWKNWHFAREKSYQLDKSGKTDATIPPKQGLEAFNRYQAHMQPNRASWRRKHATNTTNQQNLRPRSRHKASPASQLSWALCGDSWSRTLGELARMLHKVRRTQSESNSHKKATNKLGSDRPGKRKIYNQHKQGQITNSSNPKNEKLICSQFNHERIRNQHQGALEKVEVNKG